MTTRILWLSRHEPTAAQRAALEYFFEDSIEVVVDARPFEGVEDILKRMRENRAHELVLVAPLEVWAELCKRGIHPLLAQMEALPEPPENPDPNVHVHAAGRWYEFKRFRRVRRVDIDP